MCGEKPTVDPDKSKCQALAANAGIIKVRVITIRVRVMD